MYCGKMTLSADHAVQGPLLVVSQLISTALVSILLTTSPAGAQYDGNYDTSVAYTAFTIVIGLLLHVLHEA